MWVELITDWIGQKAGARIDVSDADARLLIDAKKGQTVNNDPIVEAVQKSMAEAMGKITGSITAVDAAMKDFATTLTKSRKNAVPAIFGEGNSGDPSRMVGTPLPLRPFADRPRRAVELPESGQWEPGKPPCRADEAARHRLPLALTPHPPAAKLLVEQRLVFLSE